MEKPALADVIEMSKHILHSFLNGNPEPWFDALSLNSVFVATGEETLYGAENIKKHMRHYGELRHGNLFREEYSLIPINAKSAIVMAKLVTDARNNNSIRITSYYTFVFQLIRNDTRIIYEHTSYEYFKEPLNSSIRFDAESHPMDINTFQFVKHLLIDNTRQEKICVTNGGQTIYLDTKQLLYVKGNGNGCELHCIDSVINCTSKMHSLMNELPNHFCRIHRSYIINTRYLISVRCYEAELISGIKLPIPSATYGKIKKKLESMLQRPLKKTK